MFMDPCIIVQFTKKNPTRCNNVSKFYYSIFIWSSTCFGWHTIHHQEPKTTLAAYGFLYVEDCWTCSWWTLSGTLCLTSGCQCSFRLLMMGGVLPETCWASDKYGIIKCWYIVTSCWIFLYESNVFAVFASFPHLPYSCTVFSSIFVKKNYCLQLGHSAPVVNCHYLQLGHSAPVVNCHYQHFS